MVEENKINNSFLLSSDTLSWYGLDMVFMIAKDLWFDGIDLALWNNFDSWNVDYVKRLVDMYNLPIKVIQLSNNVNKKEIQYALELAKELNVKNININAPKYYNRRATKFIAENLPLYQKTHSSINFNIINPPKDYLLTLIPQYSFTNMAEIFKTYKLKVALDISNIEEEKFDLHLIKKIPNLLPYIPVIYLSDKDKLWKWHLGLWEWNMKVPNFLKKLKQLEFDGFFSLKLNIIKKDLADVDKVKLILKKSKIFYLENYVNLKL